MATIRYKCDSCLREIELLENKSGLTTLSNCIITENCRGTLFRQRRTNRLRVDTKQNIINLEENLLDRRERKIFFPFSKSIPSKRWVINHNLGSFPAVSVFVEIDGGTNIREADKSEYIRKDINKNTLDILFDNNQTGKVHAVSRSISEQDIPQTTFLEDSINISPNGTLTIAVLSKAFGNVSTDIENPINVKFDVSLKEPNEEEVFCIEEFNGGSQSPWADYPAISFRKRRNYIVKVANLLDLKVIQERYDSLKDIPELTEFKFNGISYNGSSFMPIRSKNAILLLSSPPYTKSDKIVDRIIDLGERNVQENGKKYIFSGGELLGLNDDIETVYPPIEEDDILIRTDNTFGPTPTPPPTVTPTPSVSASVTPTPTPSISESVTPTPSPTQSSGFTPTPTSSPTPSPTQSSGFIPTPTPTPTPSAEGVLTIDAASSDEKSLSLTLTSQSPFGIAFSPDTTKLFMVGSDEDVMQYSVGDINDISTFNFDELKLNVLDTMVDPTDLVFSPNGDKVFLMDRDNIYQYSPVDPNNVTTWTYDGLSLGVSAGARGLTFSPDGTKLFVVGIATDSIEQFNIPNASDITTWSDDNLSLSVAAQEGSPNAVTFSPDGTKAFVSGSFSGSALQYSSSNLNNVSEWTYDGVAFSMKSEISTLQHIMFSPSGTKIFGLGNQVDTNIDGLFQYDATFPTDASTWSYDNLFFTMGDITSTAKGIEFSPDSSKMFLVSSNKNTILQFSVPNPKDVETWKYDGVFLPSVEARMRTIRFSPDKSKVFVLGVDGDAINQYTPIDPNDVTSWIYDNVSFSVSAQTTEPQDLFFSADGSKLYVLESNTDFGNARRIFQYSSPDANDVTTWSYDGKTFPLFEQDSFPTSIYIPKNGNKLFMLGLSTDAIHQYTTLDNNDVDTWFYDQVVFSLPSGSQNGMTFSLDETKFFIVDDLNTNDNITQYSTF